MCLCSLGRGALAGRRADAPPPAAPQPRGQRATRRGCQRPAAPAGRWKRRGAGRGAWRCPCGTPLSRGALAAAAPCRNHKGARTMARWPASSMLLTWRGDGEDGAGAGGLAFGSAHAKPGGRALAFCSWQRTQHPSHGTPLRCPSAPREQSCGLFLWRQPRRPPAAARQAQRRAAHVGSGSEGGVSTRCAGCRSLGCAAGPARQATDACRALGPACAPDRRSGRAASPWRR